MSYYSAGSETRDVLNRVMLHLSPLCRSNFVEQVPISHQSFPEQPLRFGTLDLSFTPGDISTLLCSPATLAGFRQALAVCPVEDRSWFIQRAYDPQLHAFQGLTCFTDGSFTPESASKPATVGWACAFFDPNSAHSDAFRCCVGVASGSMPDWVAPGETKSAYLAECLALAFGAWISARNFPGQNMLFLSDCDAALGAVSARTLYDTQGVAGTACGLHMLRGASSDGSLQYVYTPGHSGAFGTELVDRMAKAAGKGATLGDVAVDGAGRWLCGGGPYLPWFATACKSLRAQTCWPSVLGDSIGPLNVHQRDPAVLLQPFLPEPTCDILHSQAMLFLMRVLVMSPIFRLSLPATTCFHLLLPVDRPLSCRERALLFVWHVRRSWHEVLQTAKLILHPFRRLAAPPVLFILVSTSEFVEGPITDNMARSSGSA